MILLMGVLCVFGGMLVGVLATVGYILLARGGRDE